MENASSQGDESSLAFCWSLIVLDAPTILLNALVFLMFVHFRKKLLKSTHNSILCSMALGDTLVGVFGNNLGVILLLQKPSIYFKLLGNIPIFSSLFVSVLSLILLTVDRLVAMKKPYFYTSAFYKKLIRRLIALTWVIPGVIIVMQSLVYVEEPKTELMIRSYLFTVFFLSGLMVLLVSNTTLFLSIQAYAKRLTKCTVSQRRDTRENSVDHSYTEWNEKEDRAAAIRTDRDIRRSSKAVNQVGSHLSPEPSFTRRTSFCIPSRRRRQVSKRQELKVSSLVCLLTVSVFIILWLPLVSYRFAFAIGIKLNIPWLRRLALCLTIANSLLNPIIYLLVRKEFRVYLRRLINWLFME